MGRTSYSIKSDDDSTEGLLSRGGGLAPDFSVGFVTVMASKVSKYWAAGTDDDGPSGFPLPTHETNSNVLSTFVLTSYLAGISSNSTRCV